MHRRAFVAFEYEDDDHEYKSWGLVDISWPPTEEDIMGAVLAEISEHHPGVEQDYVVITSLAWCGPVVDGD